MLLEVEQRELKKIIQSLPSGRHTRFTIHPLATLSFQIILHLTIETTLDFVSLHHSSSTSKGFKSDSFRFPKEDLVLQLEVQLQVPVLRFLLMKNVKSEY